MTPQTLTLTEHRPLRLARDVLDEEVATRLWREYDAGRGVLHVSFPSPRSDGQWELTSRGWVGHIPLGRRLALSLQPRVPVANLFRMLEVAYGLSSFHFLDGLTATESVRDLYRRLAVALARGVLARAQHGFYRTYVDQRRRLPYLRGRVDVGRAARQPAQATIACRYQEATGDVLHNQILAWTLHTIACSGLCLGDGGSPGDERAQILVRRAYHCLSGVASLRALPATACDEVHYQRLNDDYRPLHALCRFFLEQTGPAHRPGDHQMLPFLLNMARLYERFVAEWLRAHLPAPWSLRAQEQVPLGEPSAALAFYPDLVLYDGRGKARVVLDTKYRTVDSRRQTAIPDTSEVAQVLAYAQSKGCAEAVLVYPQLLPAPFEARVGGVRVRALSFALDGDLEAAGRALQNRILQL